MVEFSNPERYELWMGRWSARLAPAFVSFANLQKGGHFLDVGTGTGALAAALLASDKTCTGIGIEPSESYVTYCRERIQHDQLKFELGDALALPFEDDSFDATVAFLILQELPDAPRAIQEMCRVTRAGGRVATSQWNFESGMPMLSTFWDAVTGAIATDSAREAAKTCMVVDYPNENALRDLWQASGLVEVETESHEINMEFASFDDYWKPFLSGVTPASSFAGELGEVERTTLRECLRRKTIGAGPDRNIVLRAEACAVRGTVP